MADKNQPAFPTQEIATEYAREGMTLRQYYAGQALAGLAADPDMLSPGCVADLAVRLADELIAALDD